MSKDNKVKCKQFKKNKMYFFIKLIIRTLLILKNFCRCLERLELNILKNKGNQKNKLLNIEFIHLLIFLISQ